MKEEEKRIELQKLCERLQSRMHYVHPELAFDALLYGWCKKRGHTKNWLSDVKRRGWLRLSMARDFADYCGYMLV
jgi:hypothetical protein